MIRSPAGALSRWSFIPVLPVLIMMVVAVDARGQAAPPPPPPPPAAPAPAPAPGTPGALPAPAPAPAPGTPGAAPAIGTIPINVKQVKTANDLTPPFRDGIQTFISAAVANLAGPNTALQTKARNALINEAMVNGLPNASATYLDFYAQTLNQQLLKLANHESPRVRLNAAIVTAEVAMRANNIHLAPTALAFLNDKSDGIVLWALKAAHWIIPAQLRFPGQFDNKLAAAIVPVVAKHSQGQVAGAIALEAYLALTIDIWDPARQTAPEHLKVMAPYVLELLQERLKLYVKGVPPAARAESFGTGFITSPRVWGALPAQQAAAMQAIVNLIALAAKQVETANPGDRFELVVTIQRASSGVTTVAPAAAAQLKPATELNPKDATVKQVTDAVQPILPAVKAVPQFAGLAGPPAVQGNAPAPPPASAPTTGNVLIPGASTQPTTGAPPGVGVPPGTTPAGGPPAAHPPAPKVPAPKADDGAAAPKAPGGTQTPRPTAPGAGGATPKTGAPAGAAGTGGAAPKTGAPAGAAGAGGAGAGGGGTTPPTPAR